MSREFNDSTVRRPMRKAIASQPRRGRILVAPGEE